jgi:hypothetical protein
VLKRALDSAFLPDRQIVCRVVRGPFSGLRIVPI